VRHVWVAGMHRLRNKLILIFIVATLAPLLVTVWISVNLLQRSLSLSPTRELDEISKSLEQTGREVYQSARAALKQQAAAGRAPDRIYATNVAADWAIGETERFVLAGEGGSRLDYLVRHGDRIWQYSASLHGLEMNRLAAQYTEARRVVERTQTRNLRRGFTYTMISLAAVIWMVSLFALTYCAHHISHPIQQLTTGLSQVAAGNLEHRVPAGGDDEAGAAVRAFNTMADQLQQSRERLVYVTRLESWQLLARKMAHEIKNSLTPIRLTMEEIAARYPGRDNGFLQQAAQIVVDEVTGLERRVRAFSELATEPPVRPKPIDVNQLLEERIAFLKAAHPGVNYNVRLAEERPCALVDEDLIKGVLTNLLENAAQAGATVLGITAIDAGQVKIEVHDSGPGLSPQARSTLFEPSISFKRGGMGLGLSIARRGAVLSGGEIQLVEGELGGAAFRVLLPAA
jgi:two-component system, NtrC family, nitrogen regulation sensor histidine kinase NtrY